MQHVRPRPFDGVIVGPGRVGSTLLASLLRTHPEVFCLNETHELPVLLAWHGRQMVSTQDLIASLRQIRFTGGTCPHDANANHAGRSPADLAAALEGLARRRPRITVAGFRDWLAGYFATASGARVVIDKTPDYAHHLPELLATAPGLRIVLMVRDALPTALSMRGHEGYRRLAAAQCGSYPRLIAEGRAERLPTCYPAELAPYLDLWADRIEAALQVLVTLPSERSLVIRYEDLLTAPKATLGILFSLFGVSLPDHVSEGLAGRIKFDAAAIAPNCGPLPVRVKGLRERFGYGSCDASESWRTGICKTVQPDLVTPPGTLP